GATLPEAEAELLELWEREGVQRCHLIGYSQGGRIALWAACNHPERLLSLTTIGAHAGFEGDDRARRREEDAALADRIERQGIDWLAAHWAALPIFAGVARRGPDFLAQLDAARRHNDPARLAAQLRGMGAGAIEPFWDRLDRVGVRTLLVVGADDERYVAYANRLRSVIRDSAVAVIPGAGHAAHLERPDAVAAVLGDHLAASPSPTGQYGDGRERHNRASEQARRTTAPGTTHSYRCGVPGRHSSSPRVHSSAHHPSIRAARLRAPINAGASVAAVAPQMATAIGNVSTVRAAQGGTQ